MSKDKYDTDKIEKMREAGVICSRILKQLQDQVAIGVALIEIDQLAEELCRKEKVIPAFKGYGGFPAVICAGPNDIVVHGIPDDYRLQSGDILSIDFGIKYEGVFSDTSVTLPLGEVTKQAQRLIDVTKEATLAGIREARPGNHVGDIGFAMQNVIESNGFSVVKEMVGHGIGRELHESPYIPGYGNKGKGEKLERGQTLAIEAIVNQGSDQIFISSDDGWTSYTEDGMLSALFEHTIVVDEEPEILTAW